LEVIDGFILTVTPIFSAPMETEVRFFPPNVEAQMLIGAAPLDPTIPIAINFFLPEAEENAC
jgi:hypothetical protein